MLPTPVWGPYFFRMSTLAFLSRSLGPKNQGLSAYEKEYMAIVIAIAVDHYRSYL
jgi:hypothetical protein